MQDALGLHAWLVGYPVSVCLLPVVLNTGDILPSRWLSLD